MGFTDGLSVSFTSRSRTACGEGDSPSGCAGRRGQAPFAPRTPQKEPVPGERQRGTVPFFSEDSKKGDSPREQAMRNTFLVCYDICDDKRLRRVFKTMRDFGDHLQYSIFECQFTAIDLAKCRHVLSEIIKHNEDQVLFVDLGPTEGRGERVISALGLPYTTLDAPCLVV